MDDLISRQAAITALSHMCSEDEKGITVSRANVDSMLKSLLPAQPEQKIYRSMSEEEFEAWLYNHGICHPDIHEPIACDIVPSLIDDAINELPPAPSVEAIPVSWIEAKIELVNSLPGASMLKMKTADWRDLVEQWKAEQRSPEVDHDAQIREFAEEMSKHGVT